MMYESDKLLIGSDVLAIGNPLGYLGGTVTKGIVSALNRDVTVEERKMTLIQTDAAINGGNSGGGLFDAQTGALIGIVNAGYKSSAAQGLSFAIPCGTVKAVMDKLLDKGYVEDHSALELVYNFSFYICDHDYNYLIPKGERSLFVCACVRATASASDRKSVV